MKDRITYAEMEAYSLYLHGGGMGLTTEDINIHKIADEIILLAEKIKAERQTSAMLCDK